MRAAEQEGATSPLMNIIRVTSGNFLEFFDFFLYGFFAKPIAATFFPAGSEFASLMLTLVVFGAGYLIRPLGAIVLGAYVDRVGRRKGLILSLCILAAGTVLIAFVPGYATFGIAAPLLVLLGRLLQGFSAGGEPGSVAVYLAEVAPPGRKGLYVAAQSCSQQVATVAAGLAGFAVNSLFDPATVTAWGWRIPFVAGCLVVPFLFRLRRSLEETQVFAARKRHPTTREILASLAGSAPLVLGGMMMVMMTTVSFYLITTYTPTFGEHELHLSRSGSLVVACCVGVSNLFWLPISGFVSDLIGRRPILIAFTLLTILTAYPAMRWLVADPSIQRMLAVELWLSFLYASYNGSLTVALTEIIPPEVRVSGFALAYSLATTLGGFSLAISTWLIERTGDKAAPGLWMSAAALCGLVATVVTYRRRASPVVASRAAEEAFAQP